MLRLVKPAIEYKEGYLNAMREFQSEGRNTNLDLKKIENNFESFLTKFKKAEKGVESPKGYVAASTYWLIDNDEFIGRVSIRHSLTDELKKEGGHIGYDIRPSKRRMGYGTKALELALPLAREIGVKEVLITCDDDNVGSWKIIEKNGGALENKTEHEGKLIRRYWIKNNL